MDEQQERKAPQGLKWPLTWVNVLPLDGTDRLRLHHFTIFLVLGLPVLLLFALYHFLYGNFMIGLVALGFSASLVLARLLLRRTASGLILYRLNAAMFGAMLLWFVALGGHSGSKALWMITFPLITNFLLGRREGAVWGLLLFLAASPLLWGLPMKFATYPYEHEFAVRFAIVYLVVAGIGYWFEYLRQHYRAGMQKERRTLLGEQIRLKAEIESRVAAESAREALILELREALSKVKMLSGLLPICASCKKIRDDRGQWLQVETYVRDRSEAKFTHGICPECSRQFREAEGLPPK